MYYEFLGGFMIAFKKIFKICCYVLSVKKPSLKHIFSIKILLEYTVKVNKTGGGKETGDLYMCGIGLSPAENWNLISNLSAYKYIVKSFLYFQGF